MDDDSKSLLIRNIYRAIRDAHIPNEYWYADFKDDKGIINIYIKSLDSPKTEEHWILKKDCLINKNSLGDNSNAVLRRSEYNIFSYPKSRWGKCCRNIKSLFGRK